MMTEREREKEKEERRDSGTAGETSRVVTEEKGRLCAREAKVRPPSGDQTHELDPPVPSNRYHIITVETQLRDPPVWSADSFSSTGPKSTHLAHSHN